MAAVHWGAAQWPYDENNEQNIASTRRSANATPNTHACRSQVEAVWVPFKDTALPGLAASAARLQRRPAAGGGLGSRHGQLQGNPGRALRRPLAEPRHRGAGDRRAGPIRGADDRHLFQHGELDRDRHRRCVDWLATRPRIDATRGRRCRHELRLASSARCSPRTSRASGLRGHVGVPRAGLPHDLPGGVADIQEALHVHVGHDRRGRVRPVPQGHDLGRPCRQDQGAVSLRRRRSRGAVARSIIRSG